MIDQSAIRYTSCFTDSHDTKENIHEKPLLRKQELSARKHSRELSISVTSVRRILKIDLGLEFF